jgi:hypothetical protein
MAARVQFSLHMISAIVYSPFMYLTSLIKVVSNEERKRKKKKKGTHFSKSWKGAEGSSLAIEEREREECD